jgi:hypothetical protein
VPTGSHRNGDFLENGRAIALPIPRSANGSIAMKPNENKLDVSGAYEAVNIALQFGGITK